MNERTQRIMDLRGKGFYQVEIAKDLGITQSAVSQQISKIREFYKGGDVMISVGVSINGKPIYARSAKRVGDDNVLSEYLLDSGETVQHNPSEGAIKLAIKMLETIKEV